MIDEGNLEAAIKLLNENKDADPNMMFYNNLPIIKAVMNGSIDLFNALVSHPKFDMSLTEGFGEPYAHFILLVMGSYHKNNKKEVKSNMEMCMSLLTNEGYDNNRTDSMGDTLLHIVSENKDENSLEVAKYLIEHNRNLLNERNMFGYTPLAIAVEEKNIEMIKLLLTCEEVEITDQTKELAKANKLDLDKFRQEVSGAKEEKQQDNPIDETYEDLFAKAFSSFNE